MHIYNRLGMGWDVAKKEGEGNECVTNMYNFNLMCCT